MQFAPHTDDDVRGHARRAAALGSLDDLFGQIPAGVRLDRELDIPEGLSELALLADMRGWPRRNRHADDLVCFAGGGAYDHYVPAVVWALAGRSELYTVVHARTSRRSRRASCRRCSSSSRWSAS